MNDNKRTDLIYFINLSYMDLEIQNVQEKYQTNLQKLQNYVASLFERISKWRIPTYLRNYYQRYIRNWETEQKEKLLREKEVELRTIRRKYNKAPNRRKQACLVGINYENSQYKLNGCVNDVYKLRRLLMEQYGYDSQDIKIIINQNASRRNILNEFTRLVSNAVDGDTICFSFSGHGVHTQDRNGDEADGRDELIVSADFYGITDDEFKHILKNHLKKGVKMFALFDNCHSGTILDLKYQYLKQAQPSLIVHEKCQPTEGQVICLSGCQDDQVSMDAYLNGQYNGAMTWALVDLLSKEKDLSWEECTRKVRERLSQRNFKQLPQLTSGIQFEIKNEKVTL